ncbi:MAG: diguanylate cyclase, partial [Deltaproteobacteria bacterium]|nr:diguanylate cyclase [Deltaproteobacteria bacterium]
LGNSFLKMFAGILSEKLSLTTDRAKLYEEAVLEKKEINKYNKEITQLSQELKKELQQKLAQIKLYSQVVEFNQDAIVIADDEGNLQSANQAFHDQFGYSSQEISSLNLKHLFKYFISKKANWNAKFKKGWKEQKTALRKDQTEFPAQITISPVKTSTDENNELTLFAAMVKDITIQKEYENNLLKTNEELKQTYDELERTISELEKTNQAKNQFFSNISSQLKTPIVTSSNIAERLRKNVDGEVDKQNTQELINHFKSEIGKLDQLVENMLSMAELTPELSNLEFKVFGYASLIKELRFRAENVTHIQFETDPDISKVYGDKNRLIQALVDVLVYFINQDKQDPITIQSYINHFKKQLEIKITHGDPKKFFQKQKPFFYSNLADGIELQIQKGELSIPFAKKIIDFHHGEFLIFEEKNSEQVLIKLPLGPKSDINSHINVILIDEHEWDRRLLRGVIEKHFHPQEVFEFDSQISSMNAINAIKPNLIIVDPFFTKPDWDYVAFIQKLCDNNLSKAAVLVISDQLSNLDKRNKIISQGITDFLFKPFTTDDALFKIKSIIEMKQLFYRMSHNIKIAEKSAATDGMTNLFNRKYYDNFFSEQIIKAELQQGKCSLIMLDVDNFKHYNDTNGHQLGDDVLKIVSSILINGIRQSDMAARYGGEEFVVVLPGTSIKIATKIAEKLRKTIEKTKFQYEELQPLGSLTASFGVAAYPDNGHTPENILKSADHSLYQAKEQGRNRVVEAEGIIEF